ncbi:hypothetical protein DB31_8532 [Hyalangium minutum]|uniref:Uncharacterized protein n=1 Tax=Hyalangium minutum TaxID=394096 RepID=A0A085WHL6_9BACT|nr:hypothetical protein DB31_8532 [Hyalangium minutum]
MVGKHRHCRIASLTASVRQVLPKGPSGSGPNRSLLDLGQPSEMSKPYATDLETCPVGRTGPLPDIPLK